MTTDPAEQSARAKEALTALLALLDLEDIDTDIFRGLSPKDRWQRVFGGQVLGQALVAASRTVEGRECHSLHAYFLRAGDPKIPILYEVDRSRDGLSFSARRVVAVQHNEPIFTMSASFEVPEAGLERPIEIRPVEPPNRFATGRHPPRQIVWFRAAGPLPTTAALHQCVLAYASD